MLCERELENFWEWYLRQCLREIEGVEPDADALPQLFDVDAAIDGGKWIEAAQCCVKQRRGARVVLLLQVVKCGCGLDQCLEESLVLSFTLEPDLLPMFVGEKELLVPVAAQAFGERTVGPVQDHCVLIIVQKW